MKRSGLPPRRAWIARSTKPIAHSGETRTPRKRRKPIKARGPAKAKREARYKAFLSSAVWKRLRKEALERAGHQCEDVVWAPQRGQRDPYRHRCPATEKLTVHHKTYARFGGKELPDDLIVLCKSCHDRHSALTGKRIA